MPNEDHDAATALVTAATRARAAVGPLEDAVAALDDRHRNVRGQAEEDAQTAIEACQRLLETATRHQRRVGGAEGG